MFFAREVILRPSRTLLFLCVLLLFLGARAGSAAAASLRVVTDNNYPPYVISNADGQPEGYIVDLWRLWERKTGVQVEFKAMQWADAQRAMHDGQADVIDMIFRTPVREQLYDFSQPYANLPVNIYVDASIHGIRDAKELAGFTVGVQRGDACVDMLASLGIHNMSAYPDYAAILAAAQAGEVKMFCMDEAPANYYLYLHREQLRFAQAFQLYEGQFHWAVNKGDQASFALVNQGMALITAEEREALRKKWFSAPFEFRPYVRVLVIGSLAVVGVLSVAGLWIWMLRRSVRTRTTELSEANRELSAEKARLRTIVDSSPDAIALKDRDGVYVDCNVGIQSRLGLPRDQIIGRTDAQIFSDSRLSAKIREHDLQVMNSGSELRYEQEIATVTGELRHLDVVKVPISGGETHISGVLVVARDVTERHHAEQELRIAAVAFESHNGLMIVSAGELLIERVNAAFTRITGYSAQEALGRVPGILKSNQHPPAFYEAMWTALQQQGHWHGEVVDRHREGHLYTACLSITAVKDELGQTIRYIGDIQDISAEKLARAQAEHLKLYDPLTELPNRTLLVDRMQHALHTSDERGEYGAVTMLDLDHFRKINDSLGHGCGDQVLLEIAHRIRQTVGEGDTLARFSGDTFVIVTERLGADQQSAARHALVHAEAARKAVETPITLNGRKLVSTASIGTTLFLGLKPGCNTLLQQAELAMYKSKNEGRNLVRFFEDAMQQEINRLRWLEDELREALVQDQFVLYYQLQVDVQGRPIGAEALVRWIHPERGLVSPAEFIPLAEETGLIEGIGQWALATACDRLAAWAKDEALQHLSLAVNVSPRQFKAECFVNEVLAEVGRSGARVSRLKLEVTESLAIDRFDDSIGKLQVLRRFGCAISLDDFGTGNSSLNYLTRLPLSQLKIDKTFVDKLPDSAPDVLVAKAIIAMGHGLGLEVIAEGVETAAQQASLAGMGCMAFQGYLFGRPQPAPAFEQAVRDLQQRQPPQQEPV